jgi:enoyl-CoA hydratase
MLQLVALTLGSPLHVTRHASGWLELTLNRPEKLNALSSELVNLLSEQAVSARAPGVKGVLLTASPGRAFCAGGDIREVAAMPLTGGQEFLRQEYQLMQTLKELNAEKPVVALADGFVIGAGGGLFMAAGTRIASLSSSFSMPETVLGIVPDVGASDFLPMMPGQLGRWAALTGARLAAPMMAATGVATHAIVAEEGEAYDSYLQLVRERILASDGVVQLASSLRDEYAAARAVAEFVGEETLGALDAAAARTFGAGLEQLDERLTAECDTEDETVAAWAKDARARLRKSCPAALLVADECARAKLGDEPTARRAGALGMEFAANIALAGSADFQEGVSCAVGAKKGERPVWRHASVDAAAADPAVQAVLEAVRSAPPLTSL